MHEPGAKAKQIALLLMNAMDIPDDRSLVTVFGCGDETSNLEAVTAWVESHMHEIDADEVIQRLEWTNMSAATCRGGTYAKG